VSIRLSEDEAWAFLAAGHTGILTTLRADGSPVTLPTWFAVLDRAIYLTTPARAKKTVRARNDPRAAFLVESGTAWAELAAVHVNGRLVVVPEQERPAPQELLDAKYAAYRSAALPAAARDAYAGMTMLRLDPEGKLLTWDNSRM
jgi:nitroimidazol reductase NimA-like FMN-containing flavoprotein (pyridoxamine 5'-phosphate oxidase superfamily)